MLSPGPLNSARLQLSQATSLDSPLLRHSHQPVTATHRDACVLLALVGGSHHGQVLDDFLGVLCFPSSGLTSERNGDSVPLETVLHGCSVGAFLQLHAVCQMGKLRLSAGKGLAQIPTAGRQQARPQTPDQYLNLLPLRGRMQERIQVKRVNKKTRVFLPRSKLRFTWN